MSCWTSSEEAVDLPGCGQISGRSLRSLRFAHSPWTTRGRVAHNSTTMTTINHPCGAAANLQKTSCTTEA